MKSRMVSEVCQRIAECGLRVIAATRPHGPKTAHHPTFSAPGLTRYAGHTLHHTSRTTKYTPHAILLSLAMSLSGGAAPAYGQETACDLCGGQDPACTGTIEPDSGVCSFSIDATA